MTYDDTGNVTVDSKFRNLAFQYDANNRHKQSSAVNGSGAVVSVYDAGGQRVATQVGGALTNVLVYDADGQLIAEYGSSPPANNGTQYVTTDLQDSPRVVTNAAGTVISRHDYLPFGEELGQIGMRNPGQGYGGTDNVRHKYAGMENDAATGMAHTLWRNYDPLSARWSGPDPYGGSMDVDDPQSFNRYSYVENDPVNKIDPLGLALKDIGVEQTNDPAHARALEEASDYFHKIAVNAEYAARHGGTVQYDEDGKGTFKPKRHHAQEQDPVERINHKAFSSMEGAIAYYERLFGGPVSERHGKFYLASWLRVRDAQNRVAGWIHSTSPIGSYVTGTLESIFGAPAADTASEEYAQGETAATVAAFFTPGPGGKIKGLKLAFGHGARHLAGSGLSQRVVERAIRSHAKQTLRSASESGSFWGRVVVGGRTVEYRAHTLADGTINIGTYYLK